MRPSISRDLSRALLLLTLSFGIIYSTAAAAQRDRDGFESLFNGRDFTGWRNSGKWKIENGTIASIKGRLDDPTFLGGLQFTAKRMPFDFELCFEWKVEQANRFQSEGTLNLMHFVETVETPRQTETIWTEYRYATGMNAIVLSSEKVNIRYPPTEERWQTNSVHCTPQRDFPSSPGKWNQGRIVYQGPIIQHWVNGQKALEVDLAHDPKSSFQTDEDSDRCNLAPDDGSIFQRQFERWKELRRHGLTLSLHSQGHQTWYRNIKFRSLVKEK